MFIRQTQTRNTSTGERYFTYRLVRGERIGGKVRQITVLNLGRHFPVAQDHWPLLCSRIEQLWQPQQSLAPLVCSDAIERMAQRCFEQLIARSEVTPTSPSDAAAPTTAPAAAPPADFQEVDVQSLSLSQPRSVGVEYAALAAVSELGLVAKLAELGVPGVVRASILGTLIGRMTHPASERATWRWLQNHSALGELLEVDFNALSPMALYRASDVLMKHRAALEGHVFDRVKTLFSLEETVTLYDLTNTYFEGEAAGNDQAHHGRSKEKRTDCPLLTLGLVLDGSGFVRRSQTFAGNVSEGSTLESMLAGLAAPHGALVIMDAGIATEANLVWLRTQGYRYLVVRRGGSRQFNAEQALAIETAGGQTVRLQKTLSEDGQEVLLYCHSIGREAKEKAMSARFCQAFEAGLQKMSDGLSKPRAEKRYDKLLERLGRLKQKSRGASQHYTVTLTPDPTGKNVTALNWQKAVLEGTQASHPGVYCLRSNELTWDEETLWRTYSTLTDLEAVFRSLKSELGLRPIFHSKEDRADGHLFITVLAYQCVQLLRSKLKAAGITDSWNSLREVLSVQRRVTTSLLRKDGRTLHIRKATVAEPALQKIYQALAINPAPGGTKKMIA